MNIDRLSALSVGWLGGLNIATNGGVNGSRLSSADDKKGPLVHAQSHKSNRLDETLCVKSVTYLRQYRTVPMYLAQFPSR